MHFTAYAFILRVPLCVLIRQDYLFTLRFLKHLSCQCCFLSAYFCLMVSLTMFFSAFISLMLQELTHTEDQRKGYSQNFIDFFKKAVLSFHYFEILLENGFT